MKKLLLFVAALATSATLMAQTTYEKVTSTPTDWTGTYLIVYEKKGIVFNGAADKDNIDAKDGPAAIQDVTITDGKITGTDELDAATFTIESTGDDDWAWAIKSASGLYIGHKDSLDNGLSAETKLKNKCKHKLSINSDGDFIATPQYSEAGEYNLQYNKDQLRFRYYTPGDKKAVQIYKQSGNTNAIETLTETKATVTKRLENGQVVILRNGKRYNIAGAAL